MGTKSRKSVTDRELIQFNSILQVIKRVMRDRKISYADLGKKLNLSESGVKKIFGSDDCSFSRLSQITGVLGLKISDILEDIENSEMKPVRFSDRQQAFLLENLNVFRFFVKLAIERESLPEIQREFGLQPKEIFKLLKKLDDIGLVEVHPGDEIKLPPLSPVRDFGPGPLLSKVYQDWGASIVKDLADPKHQSSGRFIVRCLKMKEDTYQELLSRLLELEAEFLRRAVREMRVSTLKLKTVRWMWLTDNQSFIRGNL